MTPPLLAVGVSVDRSSPSVLVGLRERSRAMVGFDSPVEASASFPSLLGEGDVVPKIRARASAYWRSLSDIETLLRDCVSLSVREGRFVSEEARFISLILVGCGCVGGASPAGVDCVM